MEYAILFERFILDDGLFIFKPIQVIGGQFDKENAVFNSFGMSYSAMSDPDNLDSNDKFYFDYVIDIGSMYEFSHPNEKTEGNLTLNFKDLMELSDNYFDIMNQSIYIGKYDTQSGGIKLMTIPYLSMDEVFECSEKLNNDMIIKELANSYEREIEDYILGINTDLKDILTKCSNLKDFCYANGIIEGLNSNDIEDSTFKYVGKKYEEIDKKIKEVNLNMDLKHSKAESKIIEFKQSNSKVEEVKEVNNFNPNAKKYPEYSYDDIYNGITDVVIDQDEPVSEIAAVLYKRLTQLIVDPQYRNQFGMMVTGSTGVGKSEIFKTFASIIDFPILFADASQLTKAGYVGRDIEGYLTELFLKTNKDMDKTKKAIVIFDEIDKIKSTGDPRDVGGKAVQDMLLKFMDGTTYNCQLGRNGEQVVPINTSCMTPIYVGAYMDLYKNKEKDHRGNLGFSNDNHTVSKEIEVNDFVKYGMSDEFMGRHHILIHLNDLNENSLKNILLKSSKSPLKCQKAIYENLGIDIIFDKSYIEAVARKAKTYGTGARGRFGIVENTTWRPTIEISQNIGKYNKLVLTDKTVKNP